MKLLFQFAAVIIPLATASQTHTTAIKQLSMNVSWRQQFFFVKNKTIVKKMTLLNNTYDKNLKTKLTKTDKS